MRSAGSSGEHAPWGHARIWISRASNARSGESPHALTHQPMSNFGEAALTADVLGRSLGQKCRHPFSVILGPARDLLEMGLVL